MEKEIENIIRDNQFSELSPEDKLTLEDWVSSEEEFDVLKQILSTAASLNDEVAPSPKLRASLTDTFNAHHAGIAGAVNTAGSGKAKVIWMRMAISAAAILVLFLLIFPFNSEKSAENLTAENKRPVLKENKDQSKEVSPKSIDNEIDESNDSNQNQPIEGVRESSNSLALVEPRIQPRSSLASSELFDDMSIPAEAMTTRHSDRINMKDLPEQNRQVIQDNPALLDVLYTAF